MENFSNEEETEEDIPEKNDDIESEKSDDMEEYDENDKSEKSEEETETTNLNEKEDDLDIDLEITEKKTFSKKINLNKKENEVSEEKKEIKALKVGVKIPCLWRDDKFRKIFSFKSFLDEAEIIGIKKDEKGEEIYYVHYSERKFFFINLL
jgi:hypothetical protein